MSRETTRAYLRLYLKIRGEIEYGNKYRLNEMKNSKLFLTHFILAFPFEICPSVFSYRQNFDFKIGRDNGKNFL